MKVFRSFSIPKKFNDSVIAIGNFDGLHLGHQEVINEAKKISFNLKIALLKSIWSGNELLLSRVSKSFSSKLSP